jgi:hypothetical protein
MELKRAENRIKKLEAETGQDTRAGSVLARMSVKKTRRTLSDGTRQIAENIRKGRPVTPDDIFRVCQPLMRDLAPLFDRMRVREQQKEVERMSGNLARKYDLTPMQQEQLKQWFQGKSEEAAKRWSELLAKDGTRLVDVMQASRDIGMDEGLDAFMPGVLSGDKLAEFKNDRLLERAQRVEKEADRNMQRLSRIVDLDETQRDQIFGIMARNSKNYDQSMVMDGAEDVIAKAPVGDRQQLVLSVLRPDQRIAYEAERERRREEAAKDMAAIGLALPDDWEMFENEF